jgi:energy-coupling factor transport system substrate-specific component
MFPRLLTWLIYGLTNGLGLVAFLYPFWRTALPASGQADSAHADDATLVLTVLVLLCFAILLLEVQSQMVNTKTVALLGMLVAINATLRVIDNLLPIPGGFSPIFVLIVLTGYVYGGRFGFLLGALTLLVSALLTGGVGPWLPYQMFTAGWVGMTAPLCRVIGGRRWAVNSGLEVGLLAAFGGIWGLLFGAMMNIWFWPFAVGDPTYYWQPGIGVGETLRRYLFFYLATSLVWDLFRLAGNSLLILAVGAPVLRILRRFHARFDFTYQPRLIEPRVSLAATRNRDSSAAALQGRSG